MHFKNFPLVLLFLTFLSFSQERNRQTDIYFNTKGEEVSSKEFREGWVDAARWDYINSDGNRICTLDDTIFLAIQANHNSIKDQLELITGKEINPDATILIEYHYLNDLCTSKTPDNHWTKSRIKDRKKILKAPLKHLVKSKNTFVISLFEKSITLDNDRTDESEYFYLDKDNYFRSRYFLNHSLCGSYAVLKPNGQLLIRNGENRIDMFKEFAEQHWNSFFPAD